MDTTTPTPTPTPTPIETKAQLVETVREWVQLDADIQRLQKELKPKLAAKKRVSSALYQVCRDSGISNFDLKEGQLRYRQAKTKQPITKKLLYNVLLEYYEGNHETAQTMHTFIHEKRPLSTKESLKATKHANATS